MNATHEGTCGRIRTEVISRCEGTSCIVHIVTFVAGKGVQVLCRHVETYIRYVFAKPFVGEVVAQFYIGNFPISCVLNFAVAEEIVPGQAGTVGDIGTWYACLLYTSDAADD